MNTNTSTTRRCQGKRRKQRGGVFGLFACGRKATTVATSYVGTSKTYYICDDNDCYSHVAAGYSLSCRPLAS